MLMIPPTMKAVLLEVPEKIAKAMIEDTTLDIPIITAPTRGSTFILALSKNGAV